MELFKNSNSSSLLEKQNEALLKIAGRAAKLGGWVINLDTMEMLWSDEVARIHGLEPGDQPTLEEGINFYIPEDRPRITALVTACMTEGIPYDAEFQKITAKGDRVWVRTMGEAIRDESGRIVRIQGAFQDITEEKKKQLKIKHLEETSQKLLQAMEQSPVSIVISNKDGIIEYVNAKFYEVTGYRSTEVIGKNHRILKSGHQDNGFYEKLWGTILSGNEWSGELVNKKQNGDLYWEYEIISPLKNKEGEVTHFVAIKEDISEKKKMHDDLLAAIASAERANRLKDAFIANMSHEIRSPLYGILGLSEIVEDKLKCGADEEDAEIFEGIKSSGKRLMRTVDLILNYSKAQTENIEITKEKLYPARICENLVTTFKIAADKKGLNLSFHNFAGDVMISADEYTITEAVSNLIHNAIKYTNSGFIKVKLILEEEVIKLSVEDSGIGISKDNLDKIFMPYMQENIGYGKTYEGIGLGLSLVKRYLQLNDADIAVSSSKGEGSKFTIIFKHE